MHCKPLRIEYVMYVYGLCLLFDFATKNLHLATIFYHLVTKWRLNNFFNFEPCSITLNGGLVIGVLDCRLCDFFSVIVLCSLVQFLILTKPLSTLSFKEAPSLLIHCGLTPQTTSILSRFCMSVCQRVTYDHTLPPCI